MGLKDLWTPPPADVYSAPVNIGDPASAYAAANCKNGYVAYCGIWLDHVGAETLSSSMAGGRHVPSAYSEIVVGDDAPLSGNPNLNVFDNMRVGVYAATSNVTCVNNLFMNMVADASPIAWPTDIAGIYSAPAPLFLPTGDGVFASSSIDGSQQKRLQVISSSGSSYNNRFYGFDNGVQTENYYVVTVQHTHMINKTPTVPRWMLSPGYRSGSYGVNMNSAHYYNLDVSSNHIYNVNTGICLWQLYQPMTGSVWSPRAPIPYEQYTGSCSIQNNTIDAHPLGRLSITNEAIQKGIVVQNALTSYSSLVGLGGASGQLTIDGNNIQNAYSGIFASYIYQQKATSNSNYITLMTINNNGLRFGINHTVCTGDAIWTNTVTTSSGSVTPTTDTVMRAYFSNTNTGASIMCNIEDKATTGFEFYGTNAGAIWRNNTMEDNLRGLALNGGIMGRQGSSSSAINNTWAGSYWDNVTSYHTYVYHGANAKDDTMYVQGTSGAPSNPNYNFGAPTPNRYAIALGNIQPATGGFACPPPLPIRSEDIDLYNAMIRQSVLYATSTMPKKWMNQYELWREVQYDTALVDSSTAIAQFATMAANSRYAYLTNVETQLYTGNVDSALTLLSYPIDPMANTDTDAITGVRMADSITADNIVGNYRSFYNVYIKYMEVAMTPEDSTNLLALAQLCPHKEGMVVYQARALYSYVFNDLSMFNDDSCLAVDTAYIAEWKHGGGSTTAQDIGGQGYQLFPNPNDGNITLRQTVSDTGMIRIEVYDVVGRSVYKKNIQFSAKTAKLQLNNVPPGIYILQLTGTDDKAYRFKFVKE